MRNTNLIKTYNVWLETCYFEEDTPFEWYINREVKDSFITNTASLTDNTEELYIVLRIRRHLN